MTQEKEDYALSDEQLNRVQEKTEDILGQVDGIRPAFYTITGSHLYGYPSASSDIDVCGFHICPPKEWVSIEGHRETVKTTQPGIQKDGEMKDVELKSYEMQKMGGMLVGSNPNTVEMLFSDKVLINGIPSSIRAIKELLEAEMPMNIPHRYSAMARGNFKKYLKNPDRSGYRPQAKKYLHVLRGLLGAKYVHNNGMMEPRLTVMAESVMGGDSLVRDIIAAKRQNEGDLMDNQLEAEAKDLTEALIDKAEYGQGDEVRETLTPKVDEWMIETRKNVQSR